MLLLGFLYILTVGGTIGYEDRQRKFLLPQADDSTNTRCPHLNSLGFKMILDLSNGDEHRLSLYLGRPSLVQKINIDTSKCYHDRSLIEKNFTVRYVDAADILKEERTYSDQLLGTWSHDENIIEIWLDPVVYTDHLTLVTSDPFHCSSITMQGCSTQEMCPKNPCKNNGTCIGDGLCVCKKGFMGDNCDVPVSKMTYDDYEFVTAFPGLLITKDAVFDVSGDVTFSTQPSSTNVRSGRTYHSYSSHHGSSAHYFGHGGSCHYSSLHSSGVSHSGHTTYGYHPSYSSHGCVLSHQSGYSHTAQVSYGHNHNHHSTHYLYTTHGTSHHSHGASLHYYGNQLNMHVHDYHHSTHHHYHVQAPFNPAPGQTYSVCSTYSPQSGAGIYVNGQQVACQTKPTTNQAQTTTTPTTPRPSSSNTQKPLCFGTCGAPNHGGVHNCTVSNIGLVGGSVPFLAQQGLFGLLGTAMMSLLLQALNTTNTPAVATTHAHGFTFAPTHKTTQTTLPPASATTNHNYITKAQTSGTTSKYGPVCYDCMHVSDSTSCTSKFQCNKNEVCLVFHDKNGYTQRCIDKQDCQTGQAQTSADCWECCDHNLCNKNCTQAIVRGPAKNCQDDAKCNAYLKLAPYYDVCLDPVYSTTLCKRSCGKCV